MKPDLTTLDGQRRATRRGAYVVLGAAACGVLWAVLARYPEDRLQAAAMICFVGGMSGALITVLREMSLRQKWKDEGSVGSPSQQSKFEQFFRFGTLFLGFPCSGILLILSGSLYPHWRHVDGKHNPWGAMMIGSLIVLASLAFVFGVMLPAIYKAHFRRA